MNNEETRKFDRFQRSLRSLPHFSNEGTSTWRAHELAYSNWYAANNISTYTPYRQKLALLLSLTGKATRAVELYGLGTVGFGLENDAEPNAVPYQEYKSKIKSVFQPKSETNLSRMEFKSRSQNPAEPPQDFCSEKISLYHAAEPEKEKRSYQYLRQNIIKSLYSPLVRSWVIDLEPSSEEELLAAVARAAGEAKEKFLMRCPEVTSLDGLHSTTRYHATNANKNSSNLPAVEDMEIDKIDSISTSKKDLKCHFCNKKGHLIKDCFKKKKEGGGQRKKEDGGRSKKDIKCFNCNKKGHVAKECRSSVKKKERIRKIDSDDSEEGDEEDIEGAVNSLSEGACSLPFWQTPVAHGRSHRETQQ